MHNSTHRIAILTVNYKQYLLTKDFVKSIKVPQGFECEVFVSDVTPKEFRKEQKFEGAAVKVHTHIVENKGYAFGLKMALNKAMESGFENFVVINNDTEVDENFLQSIATSLGKNPNSLIGGKIYYFAGSEYHKDRYSKDELGKVLWYAGGENDWANVYIRHRGVDEVDKGQYDKTEETDFVTGCLMIFNKKLVDDVGFMDEEYFLYFEDADWCERIKRSGKILIYDPTIVIWHKNSQSTDGSGSKLQEDYQNKNRLRYGLKYAPLRTKLHLLKNLLLKK